MTTSPRMLLALFIGALALLPMASSAAPQFLMPKEPAGDEIRAVGRDFLEQIARGDLDGARALFSGPSDHEKLLEVEVNFVKRWDEFVKSLKPAIDITSNSHFQSPADLFHQRSVSQMERIVIQSGEWANISSAGAMDGGLDLRRVEGKWKVVHLAAEYRQATNLEKVYSALANVTQTVKAAIDSGRIHGSDEIVLALETATKKITDQWLVDRLTDAGDSSPATQPAKVGAAPNLVLDAVPLLGKATFDPEVRHLLLSLPGLPRMIVLDKLFFITSYDGGVSLSFAKSTGALQAIIAYGAGDSNYAEYLGKLPLELKFGEPRKSVERQFGRPSQLYAANQSHFEIAYPEKGLSVTFERKSPKDPLNPVQRVTFSLPWKPQFVPTTQPAAAEGHRLAFKAEVGADESGAADSFADPNDTTGKTIRKFSRQAIVDESDVENVYPLHPRQPGDRWKIAISFTHDGGIKLNQFSTGHVGKLVGIFVDGKLLIAPMLRGHISQSVIIDMGAHEGETEAYELAYRMQYAVYSLPDADLKN